MTTLRKPTPRDAHDLAAMVDELNAHEGDPTGHFTPDRAFEDVIAPGAPVSCLLAEEEGALVGYAFWHFGYETAWAARGSYLADLYVRMGFIKAGTDVKPIVRGLQDALPDVLDAPVSELNVKNVASRLGDDSV